MIQLHETDPEVLEACIPPLQPQHVFLTIMVAMLIMLALTYAFEVID